jgi:chromosome condensin MukBEF complex kleisin-like MukF subunit
MLNVVDARLVPFLDDALDVSDANHADDRRRHESSRTAFDRDRLNAFAQRMSQELVTLVDEHAQQFGIFAAHFGEQSLQHVVFHAFLDVFTP